MKQLQVEIEEGTKLCQDMQNMWENTGQRANDKARLGTFTNQDSYDVSIRPACSAQLRKDSLEPSACETLDEVR